MAPKSKQRLERKRSHSIEIAMNVTHQASPLGVSGSTWNREAGHRVLQCCPRLAMESKNFLRFRPFVYVAHFLGIADRCWERGGPTWLDCCAPSLGDGGNPSCFSLGGASYEECCWSSPEVEPMLTDLEGCANDPGLRQQYFRVAHAELGLRKDCSSVIGCQATPEQWVAVELDKAFLDPAPQCELEPASPRLEWDVRMELCATMLKPLPAEVWYDGAGFERARLRYRFGKARRSHCAVPNWRLLREEPLRLYALISARSQVLPRILINVGAGDAQADDPLGLVLTEFARAGRPWTGVYFEAIPENCAKASSKLAETGAIHLECAYATPDTVP